MTYKEELIGVIVICYPHLALKGRNIALNNELAKMTKENCTRLNNEFDYIARVIIRPKYRGAGLSYYMLNEYFKMTPAKYTETLAVMSQYTPFFQKAGMTRIDVDSDGKREKLVAMLEEFNINTSLLSSRRYVETIYNSLSLEQKEKFKDTVLLILNKYKGQIVSLFSKNVDKDNWQDYYRQNDNELLDLVKHLKRANTVYSIKKLRD